MLYIFFFKIIDKKKADYVLFCKKLNLYIKSTKLIHFHIIYYGQLLLRMWLSTAVILSPLPVILLPFTLCTQYIDKVLLLYKVDNIFCN